MRVLDLSKRAGDRYKDEQVDHEPAEGVLYGEIVADREMGRRDYHAALKWIEETTARLAPGGSIHIFESSAEWAAREILGDRLGPDLQLHLYGHGDFQMHSTYTMMFLREIVTSMGLMPQVAITRRYTIAKTAMGVLEGDEHYIVGVKMGEALKKEWMQD